MKSKYHRTKKITMNYDHERWTCPHGVNALVKFYLKIIWAWAMVWISLQRLCKGASTRSYTRLFYLVLLYVYDLLSIVHIQKYMWVYEYDVLQPCWIFCRSYTCTTYKCTSLPYSDELIIIAGVSNQMVFLQDIHYKLFYILIFSIKHVKKAKLWSVEDCR